MVRKSEASYEHSPANWQNVRGHETPGSLEGAFVTNIVKVTHRSRLLRRRSDGVSCGAASGTAAGVRGEVGFGGGGGASSTSTAAGSSGARESPSRRSGLGRPVNARNALRGRACTSGEHRRRLSQWGGGRGSVKAAARTGTNHCLKQLTSGSGSGMGLTGLDQSWV
jgi:hypothetical protein